MKKLFTISPIWLNYSFNGHREICHDHDTYEFICSGCNNSKMVSTDEIPKEEIKIGMYFTCDICTRNKIMEDLENRLMCTFYADNLFKLELIR